MKIGVLSNPHKIGNRETSVSFVRFLENNGFAVTEYQNARDVGGVDVCIVLGGDGTILHAVEFTAPKGIMLIGVNYGTLGFLAEFEKNEAEEIVGLLKSLEMGDCPVLKRSMLEVKFNGMKHYALNEIVIRREYGEEDASMLKLSVEVNGVESDEILGDGALLCTPTGSTAYSLSAGGPILDPRCPVYMLTPICAFSLNARPVVLPETDTVSLKILRSDGILIVDGYMVGALKTGEKITVKKSPFTADFPERGSAKFLKKVWQKLK